MLAFAITIHKSQGLSHENAIVDAGSTNFGPGMIYVALSRVTSLNGLHLTDLDRSKINCHQKAIKEYNRLRQLYAPHLGTLLMRNSRWKPVVGWTSVCLFRALSSAVCRSQTHHDILRLYVVNHVTNPEIIQKLNRLFGSGSRPGEAYVNHLLTMQQEGHWGTDQEIATAAHLF